MEQTKPRPPSILDALAKVLEEEDVKRKEEHKEAKYRHYPSSASFEKAGGGIVGGCLRQIWWQAHDEPASNPKELTSKLQAGFGNAIHTWLTDKLKKSKEFKLIPEASGRVYVEGLEEEVSFRLDGLISHKGDLGGLEIKTMQSYGLQSMVKSGTPKDSHLLQVLSYFGTNEAIRWFSLVYFSRDSGFRAEYHLWRHPETNEIMLEGSFPESKPRSIGELSFGGIVARWKVLEGEIKAGTLPKRDFQAVLTKEGRFTEERTKNGVKYKTDFQCVYCQFREKCWNTEEAKEFAKPIPS